MSDATFITRQDKPAAMRDLILHALHQRGGVIIDSTGCIPSRIREYYGIPDSKPTANCISNALRQLTLDGIIARRTNDAQTRTYEISLVDPLTAELVAQLAAARADNLARFIEPAPRTELEQLVHDCTVTYRAMLRIARDPQQRHDIHGNVALNVTGLIQSVGIRRAASREIKHYLRELGLARALSAVDNDRSSQLWWWYVSDKELDPDRLRSLASGDKSYKAKCAERSGTPKAGPVTVSRIEATAAITPHPTPLACANLHREPAQSAQTDEADPFEELVALTEELEAKNTHLTLENTELHGRLESQQTSHQNEVDGLKARIRELEEQLRSRTQTTGRARELIERLRGKSTPAS